MAMAPRPRFISARNCSSPTVSVVRSRMAASKRGSQSISKTMRPRWWNIARVMARRRRFVQSGNACARLRSAIRRSRRATCQATWPSATPHARASASGSRCTIALTMTRMRWTMRPRRARTSARSLATLRLELFDHRRPLAARAQEPLHRLAERPLAAARVELPRRCRAHLGRRIRGGGGDGRAAHRCEVGEVVADVEDLLECDGEFLRDLLALGQLVGRALVQLVDSELARAADQRGGAAACDEGDRDPGFLREPRAEAVADVEVLDLALLARVDDLAVGPDAVDVGDDDADVGGLHCREGYQPKKRPAGGRPQRRRAVTTSGSIRPSPSPGCPHARRREREPFPSGPP